MEGPEGVFEADEGGLPVVDYFEVGDDFVEVFVPATILVLSKRSLGIIDFCMVIEDTRDQDDCDRVICASLFPFSEECWKKGMYNLFVETFAVCGKFP